MIGVASPDRPRRTIRRRILPRGFALAFLFLLAGAISMWQVNRLADAVDVLQVARERAVAAFEVRQYSTTLIAAVGRLLPAEDALAFNAEVGAALGALRTSHAELAALAAQASEDEAIYEHLDRVSGHVDGIIGLGETMVRQASAEQWPSARVRMAVLLRGQQQLAAETDDLVELTKEMEEAAVGQVASARQATVLYPAIVILVALALGAVLVLRTARGIAGAVEQLTEGATQLASGSWDQRIAVESEDELGQLATAFNQMADQLQDSYAELEQRVAERTADLQRRAIQLQTAGEVARDATAILGPHDLMARVVSLISERFGFYHAGIFLLGEAGEWAVLQAASSEGGRRMLARSHRLKVGETGIVGYVTGTGEPRIALDVGADAVFFDNPDLPQTRSEIALPMRSRGEIIGALDVQSTEAAAFTEEDVAVLGTLADQVGVAIGNARLHQQAQESLAALQRVYGERGREVWLEMARHGEIAGYRYGPVGVEVDPQAWTPAMGKALQADRAVQPATDPASLAIPVRVRGQTVGVVDITKPKDTKPWTDGEISLLQALIGQLELALDSALLYYDTQRRAAREQAIRQVTERMRRAVDVETILQATVAELARALGVPRAYVRLGTEAELGPGDRRARHWQANLSTEPPGSEGGQHHA